MPAPTIEPTPRKAAPLTVIASAPCWLLGDVEAIRGVLLDDVDAVVGVVQPSAAVLGDGDDVLDPDPEPAGEVDAGLDGEAHARLQGLLLALDHVRRLVRRDADAVTGAMDELGAVPRLGDDRTRHPVDLLAGHAGPDGVEARLLGGPHDVVHLLHLVARFTDRHRARRVRTVAVPQPPEVQHDRVAGLDHAVAGLVVRIGAVRSGADDGEVDLLVPELP